MDSIFFCKLLCTCLKDTDDRTAQSVSVLIGFQTAYRAVNDFILNSFAVIGGKMNNRRVLTCVLKVDRVFLLIQHIGGIGGQLFYIVAAERKVAIDRAFAVFVQRNNLNQTIGGDNRTVCGGKVCFCIQSKGYIKDFAVIANTVGFVCFKALYKVNFHTLPFIVEARFGFGNSNILTCIHKLDSVNFVIQHHSVRSCDFPDFVFAQIQLFGFCSSVRACGNGVNHLALRSSQRSVQSKNIFGGGNLIHRTFQPLCRKYGLIHSVIL